MQEVRMSMFPNGSCGWLECLAVLALSH